MILKCPCKDCTRRNAECHVTCTDYSDWSKARRNELSGLVEANERHSAMMRDKMMAIEKYRRNHRWK